MGGMEIRPATEHDLDTVTALGALPELTWGDGHALERDDYEQHLRDGSTFLVAEEGGAVVGFIFGERLHNGGSMVWLVSVAATHRGRGYGDQLLAAFEAAVRADGGRWVYLTAPADRASVLDFYRHRGYELGHTVVEAAKVFLGPPPAA